VVDQQCEREDNINNCEETIMWHRSIHLITGSTHVILAAAVLLFANLLFANAAHAGFDEDLAALQQRWAKARYELKGDDQKNELEKLIVEADQLAQKNSDKADGFLWAGVIRGSLAEAVGGMSALGTVKEARANLEKALSIDPNAEQGYAYGVLGLLYSKVPSVIAFGDKKKARELLQKGVEVAPNGMNTNYFLAQFLFERGEYKEALPYIERAAAAQPPSPPEQSLFVSYRQQEIKALSEKIRAKQK
jgi:tetratricopeptide (TPR) repeat protein